MEKRVLKRPGEGQFVGVGVIYVEVSFAPWCVSGLGRRRNAGLEQPCVKGINVVYVEDQSPPPTFCCVSVQYQV